jgi:molybdopterin converting factor small subunit
MNIKIKICVLDKENRFINQTKEHSIPVGSCIGDLFKQLSSEYPDIGFDQSGNLEHGIWCLVNGRTVQTDYRLMDGDELVIMQMLDGG